MNKFEQLAASVSAVALLSSPAVAAMQLPNGSQILTAEEMARLPVQRDMNLVREFYAILKPEAAGAANAVEAYFRDFGFSPEYVPEVNAVKLLGSFFQAQRAGNFTYIPGLRPTTPLRVSAKPSFPAAIESAILTTTFIPGPVMRGQTLLPPSVTANLPSHAINGINVLGLAPADYAAIYGYNRVYANGIRGQGELVDIVACRGYSATSLSSFASDFGLAPAPKVTAVTSMSGSSSESNIAVQRVYGTAPGAAIRMWFSKTCTLGDFSTLFLKVATDQRTHPATAFNISFATPEQAIAQSNSANFIAARVGLSRITNGLSGAAQKVALFAPSGDNGDYSQTDHASFGTPIGQPDVAFPASDPDVLSVGGTALILNSKFTRDVETAWSGTTFGQVGGRLFPTSLQFGGSGGGVSNRWLLPTWQRGVAGTFSQKFKNVPDVALNASPTSPALYIFFGSAIAVAGTSIASPTWAGTVALLQQEYRKKHAGKPLTNWPAHFYNKITRAGLFTEITNGTNGHFVAGSGYNNVTGLGVPCFFHFPSPCVNGK
jgi:subtilase family serine protease